MQFSSGAASCGCELKGASITTYLLEKVRLITQASNERNYHIFYEILAGASPRDKQLWYVESKTSAQHYKMISISGTCDRRDGVKDIDTYKDMRGGEFLFLV